jgi:hypothetical protein
MMAEVPVGTVRFSHIRVSVFLSLLPLSFRCQLVVRVFCSVQDRAVDVVLNNMAISVFLQAAACTLRGDYVRE